MEKKWTSTKSHTTGGILKEGEEVDLLFIVVPYPIGTLLMPYPWMSNICSSRERRGRYVVIIIILTVTNGQCIIHHTRHRNRILISTSSRMVVTLSCVCQVIHINMTPSYRTINSITQSYAYTGNNTVVIILGRTDGHGPRA